MAVERTRRKFEWLDQIARDREVPAESFRLAYIIASVYLNGQTGDAWPSQATLAARLGLRSPRSIAHLFAALERRGHVTVTVGRGRGHSNHYMPRLQADVADDETEQLDFGRQSEDAGGGPSELATGFEAWWLQYPRKKAKGMARKAYERLIANGRAKHDELLTGAMRYAGERSGQDPKYTKHPSTWLNGECWKDEGVTHVEPNEHPRSQQRMSGPASAYAGLAAWLDGGAEDGDPNDDRPS